MDKAKARENIKTISEILENLKIKWWLDAGTCLGAIRDNGFMDHDTDTDIGLAIKDSADIWYMARDLTKNGFSFIGDFGTIENGYEFSWRKWALRSKYFVVRGKEKTRVQIKGAVLAKMKKRYLL